MIRHTLALALIASIGLAGCNKDEAAPVAGSPTPAAATERAATAPVEPAATPVATPAPEIRAAAGADVDALGIPECDEYLSRYETCISDKVPEAARTALQQSLAATRDGWKQTIAAGGRDQLAAACTQMREQARASMQAYGCTDF